MSEPIDPRTIVARLHRRLGTGTNGAGLDAGVALGVEAEAARLTDPAGAAATASVDPWHGLDLSFRNGEVAGAVRTMVERWLDAMVAGEHGAYERLAWFWHGHLVSAVSKVRSPEYLAGQIRLYRERGAGSFADLLRAASTDPAMLVYLDLRESTAVAPNENYGRELMELFALGRTAGYIEADVQAAAHALTGWTVPKGRLLSGPATFVERRHDDRPQTLVGLGGVHDRDTTIAAVTGHPACATWIAGRFARAVLGPHVDDTTVTGLADRFRSGGLVVSSLLADLALLLARGVDGGPVVLAPVPWLVMAERACGVPTPAAMRVRLLRAAGQVPFDPPNVAGWPSGTAWFSSSTVVARFNLAVALAGATLAAGGAVAEAVAGFSGRSNGTVGSTAGNGDALAHALGLGAPFGPTTVAQLAAVSDPAARLALALTSPECVLA